MARRSAMMGYSDPRPPIGSVGVVGGGLMGVGIAESVAAAGLDVIVLDVDDDALRRGRAKIDSSLARAVSGGKRSEKEAAGMRDRIELTLAWEAFADVDLVVEAVPEELSLKLDVMTRLDGLVDESTIVASNTSSIPIAQLARPLSRATAFSACTSSRRCR